MGNQSYELGLTASYEIDLWGRVRSQRQAALLEVKATEADLHAAAVSLAAEVSLRWVQILSQRLQKQLLEEQLASNSTFLELIELRFSKAMVSALDVYQQKQVVENVRGPRFRWSKPRPNCSCTNWPCCSGGRPGPIWR